jgi:hypothetical protein
MDLLTPPAVSAPAFAWRNQGTATETAIGSALYLNAPATAGENIRGREIVAPATPYTLTVFLQPNNLGVNFHTCGVYFADNTTGRLNTMSSGYDTNNGNIRVMQYNSATSFNFTAVTVPYGSTLSYFLRITDNGTNMIFQYSQDGQNFNTLLTQSRTTWTANPNRVGYFCNNNNGTFGNGVTLLSWKIT